MTGDLISRQAAIDAVHKSIFDFFDICDDDEESPMTYKDKLLLEVNKAITTQIKAVASAQPIEAVPLEDYRSMEQTVYKLTQALAEAEPVKHGRWIRRLDTRFGPKLNDIIICSACNIAFSSENQIRRSYCPNCGAKMDLDEAPDCETCKDRKTCKDAPIPPIYACLGYEPAESTMGQLNSDERINYHIENDGTYEGGE